MGMARSNNEPAQIGFHRSAPHSPRHLAKKGARLNEWRALGASCPKHADLKSPHNSRARRDFRNIPIVATGSEFSLLQPARGVVLRARARREKMITGAREIYLQQPCFVSIGCYVGWAVLNEEHSDCAYFTPFGAIVMANLNTNENMTVHFKVKDYNAWRTSYNGHEKNRASAGITNSKVFRGADDSNDVLVIGDVADVSKARTWLGSSEMKTVMEKSGVVGSPSIRFAA
jgi:hypothetical protein